MLRVHLVSGEKLADIPVDELSDVRALKTCLQPLCGAPRFRQRILYNSSILADTEVLREPLQKVQLILLPFEATTQLQVDELRSAARNGNAMEAEEKLQRPQDPDLVDPDISGQTTRRPPWNEEGFNKHETALCMASRAGHTYVVQLLLEAAADVNKRGIFAFNYSELQGSTPLCAASYGGHVRIVQLLLDAHADVEKEGRFSRRNSHDINGFAAKPLFEASSNGHAHIVRLLLQAAANPTYRQAFNDHGPLCAASGSGHAEVVRVLLQAGVAIDKQAQWQDSPLCAASRGGHIDVVRLLLQFGVDINLTGRHGDTPFFEASRQGYGDLARLLLQAKADIHTPSRNDDTHAPVLPVRRRWSRLHPGHQK